jgi:lipopolysaccharide/colanic/teichoic acid biosynthesis glycosyltransferase
MDSELVSNNFLIKFTKFIKYTCDRIVAAIAILIFSPLILIVAIAIHFNMGSPVIFTQPRPGKNSRIFTFYKFRTMTDARDAEGKLLPDGDRITPFGEWLRQTSLDELPQLLNILKGDMSFIGPRPLIVEYLDRYTPEQARRHEVLPGVTGLAQINGRNAISWEEKFKLDVWYVDNWNLWLDFKILFLTFFKVLQQEGITQEGYATSEEFKGTINSQQSQVMSNEIPSNE